jgi:hypothetical protein
VAVLRRLRRLLLLLLSVGTALLTLGSILLLQGLLKTVH